MHALRQESTEENPRWRLHALLLAVGLARRDVLARLLDGRQHGVVVEGLGGDDVCRLGVETDVEGSDA